MLEKAAEESESCSFCFLRASPWFRTQPIYRFSMQELGSGVVSEAEQVPAVTRLTCELPSQRSRRGADLIALLGDC